MIPGFHGHLISESFLERHLAALSKNRRGRERAADVLIWREGCGALGPASSVRAILETAAATLLRTLGFTSLVDVTAIPDALIATCHAKGEPVAVVVTAWG